MNKILMEITDKDIDPSFVHVDTTNFRKRDSSRGILMHQGQLGLLNVTKSGYYKLPGGGFEDNENLSEAFRRELIEETGCNAEILDHGGIIIETRSKIKLIQTSYVFLSKVIGQLHKPQFDEGEVNAGYKLEWIAPTDAARIFDKQKSSDYESKFICLRDRSIFMYYREQIASIA